MFLPTIEYFTPLQGPFGPVFTPASPNIPAPIPSPEEELENYYGTLTKQQKSLRLLIEQLRTPFGDNDAIRVSCTAEHLDDSAKTEELAAFLHPIRGSLGHKLTRALADFLSQLPFIRQQMELRFQNGVVAAIRLLSSVERQQLFTSPSQRHWILSLFASPLERAIQIAARNPKQWDVRGLLFLFNQLCHENILSKKKESDHFLILLQIVREVPLKAQWTVPLGKRMLKMRLLHEEAPVHEMMGMLYVYCQLASGIELGVLQQAQNYLPNALRCMERLDEPLSNLAPLLRTLIKRSMKRVDCSHWGVEICLAARELSERRWRSVFRDDGALHRELSQSVANHIKIASATGQQRETWSKAIEFLFIHTHPEDFEALQGLYAQAVGKWYVPPESRYTSGQRLRIEGKETAPPVATSPLSLTGVATTPATPQDTPLAGSHMSPPVSMPPLLAPHERLLAGLRRIHDDELNSPMYPHVNWTRIGSLIIELDVDGTSAKQLTTISVQSRQAIKKLLTQTVKCLVDNESSLAIEQATKLLDIAGKKRLMTIGEIRTFAIQLLEMAKTMGILNEEIGHALSGIALGPNMDMLRHSDLTDDQMSLLLDAYGALGTSTVSTLRTLARQLLPVALTKLQRLERNPYVLIRNFLETFFASETLDDVSKAVDWLREVGRWQAGIQKRTPDVKWLASPFCSHVLEPVIAEQEGMSIPVLNQFYRSSGSVFKESHQTIKTYAHELVKHGGAI